MAERLRSRRGWQALLQTRSLIATQPWFVSVYLRWRSSPSPARDRLLAIEKRYEEALREAFPRLSEAKIVALHAMVHAVLTAPFLTDAAAKELRRLLSHL
jgi:hypothetical protein